MVDTTPRERYAADLAAARISPDAAQARAVASLQRVFTELTRGPMRPSQGLLDRVLGRASAEGWRPVRGLYLWGRVGRGKTYLVDTFYDCLPFDEKQRVHFHRFMRETHDALRSLREEADPLRIVAARWAGSKRVLCLDEFHVGDITDAMLLAGLLEALLAHGVTLIATSNEAPAELYSGGLQRDRFLPAIGLLESELEVLELDGETDFRLRALEQAPVYYVCAAGEAAAALEKSFTAIAPDRGTRGEAVMIEGRPIETERMADGIAWFSFEVLCGGPRATGDYIELARLNHTLVLSDVPVLGADDSDAARRFINLVDELYDRNVNLVMSAAAEPEALYTGSRLEKPFRRTASRLREMRSHDYLAQTHISD
ncbi:MAG: cell division protein ZapE [Gammaproteobacteria bacterium]